MEFSREDIHPHRFNYHMGDWARIIECCRCHLFARREDLNPHDQCWRCGGYSKKEHVARWISLEKWYNPKTWKKGFWEIKND